MPTALRQQKYPFGSLRTDPHWSVDGLIFCSQFKPAGVLIDETANKNHGVLNGPVWVGGALDFERDNTDYVISPTQTYYHTTNLTISYWEKPESYNVGDQSEVISTTFADWYGGHETDGNLRFVLRELDGGSFTSVIAGSAPPLGVWVHITWVVFSDAGNMWIRCYKNGVFIDESTHAEPRTANTSSDGLFFGGRDAASEFFDGLIGDVKIYNHVLSATEIAELYRKPNLPFQQYPAWWGKAPAAVGVSIPVMAYHYKQAGGM